MTASHLVLAVTLTIGLLAAPLAAEAQPAGKVYRLGFLSPGFAPTPATPLRSLEAFRQRLRELGYVEGQNLVIELRFSEGKIERLPALAAELVRLTPDVIVTSSSVASLAAKKANDPGPQMLRPEFWVCTFRSSRCGVPTTVRRHSPPPNRHERAR